MQINALKRDFHNIYTGTFIFLYHEDSISSSLTQFKKLIRKQALGDTRLEERRDRRSALFLLQGIWGSGVACSQSQARGVPPVIHMTLKMAASTVNRWRDRTSFSPSSQSVCDNGVRGGNGTFSSLASKKL